MALRDRKTRKLRGQVSHGHGRVGKHRKHSGGRGKCGGLSHHRTLFEMYHPDYFGKRGMRIYHRTKKFCPIITVDKLWSLVEKNGQLRHFEENRDVAPVVNLPDFGFFKVTGFGKAPHRPIVVKAKFFTPEAEKKIVSAGGQCILVA
jgi:large subunit ribosomal protein L27Ae